MASNDYHFVTHWRVKGDAQEVFDILSDAAGLPRWWPAVYLEARVIEAGDPDHHGAGRVVSLHTKGFLPYTLRWQFRVVEAAPPNRIVLEPSGDFTGRGEWTLKQDGEWVHITYDWNVTANKPLLRSLSFVLRPIFAANHRWAMRTGENSLNIELARRRAGAPDQDAEVEEPPQPTTESVVPLTIAMSGIWLGLGLLGVVVYRWLRKRRR
jgi:uncharacterized protein YndB with AHSA1/START domain